MLEKVLYSLSGYQDIDVNGKILCDEDIDKMCISKLELKMLDELYCLGQYINKFNLFIKQNC